MNKLKNNMEAKYVYIQDQQYETIPELAEIQINNRVLKCPFYGTSVRSDIDIQSLKNVVASKKLKNTQVVAYGLGDAENFKNQLSKTIFEFTGENLDYKPFSEFIITIDPVGEYLLRNVSSEVEKLISIKDIPDYLKDILQAETKDRKKLIKDLFNENTKISGVIEWYLNKAMSLNAEIGIPLCIPISGETTLNYAIKTNRLATTIQQDNGWQKAVFFLLEFKSFKDETLINTILKSINILKPNIVVFKVLNPKFLEPDCRLERSILDVFLKGLYNYRLREKALTFALNCDVSLYHYMAQGLCGAIEPIDGNYNTDIRYNGKKVDLEEKPKDEYKNFGKYPDPITLDEKSFKTLRIVNGNTKQPFPCGCPECSKYKTFVTDSYQYNRIRRMHRIHIRDEFVSELKESFYKNNLRASMFDRFSEGSKLSVFKSYYS